MQRKQVRVAKWWKKLLNDFTALYWTSWTKLPQLDDSWRVGTVKKWAESTSWQGQVRVDLSETWWNRAINDVPEADSFENPTALSRPSAGWNLKSYFQTMQSVDILMMWILSQGQTKFYLFVCFNFILLNGQPAACIQCETKSIGGCGLIAWVHIW